MEDYADLMEAVKEAVREMRVVHTAPGMMESVEMRAATSHLVN